MNIDDRIKEKYLNMDKNDIQLLHRQIAYQKMMRELYDFSNVPEDEIRSIIYPSSWYYINDDAKLEALNEAIENKIALMETKVLNKCLKKM